MNELNTLTKKLKLCFLFALEIIFCFTPLGSIPISVVVATLSMVPVIICGIVIGKNSGLFMGFTFGLFSFIYWTFIMPNHPTAFLFTPFSQFTEYKGGIGSLIICFAPRILAGALPGIIMTLKISNEQIKMIIASIVGSLTNTIFVLLFIFIFYGNEYITIMGNSIIQIIKATVLVNGLAECIVCAIICPIVSNIVKRIA